MKAMLARRPAEPLTLVDLPRPELHSGMVRVRVRACAVCRTDLHILDGELPQARYPIVPGHEIVGEVIEVGREVTTLQLGARVGIAWLGWTCGTCAACARGDENLCDDAKFTGCQLDGGYAEEVVADARFCFRVPHGFSDVEAAPLLCAGLIGLRTLRLAGDPRTLGIWGFGAAAHIVTQIARWEGRKVFAFTRKGDVEAQDFARSLGCAWAGAAGDVPPAELDGALLFAPVGAHVPEALSLVRKGGVVVCGGIHMSDIPSFHYSLLWGERVVRSVANLTRRDGDELLSMAPHVPIRTRVERFRLDQANEALARLRSGALRGAAVLVPGEG